MSTVRERYGSDVAFEALTDELVQLMRERKWTYGDFHDAWALAETIKREIEVRELTGDSSNG